MDIPKISIAAGAIKSLNHLEPELTELVSAITFGSYTLRAREGNPEPTYWFNPETNGSINSVGLKNQSLLTFMRQELIGAAAGLPKTCGLRVSLAPTESGELETMCRQIESERAAQYIQELEINGACPNHHTEAGRSPVLALDAVATEALLAEALIYTEAKAFKIAPGTGNDQLLRIVELCEQYGVETIVSGNTKSGSSTIGATKRLSMDTGGMAGQPLFDVAIDQYERLAQINSDRPQPRKIIYCGGVMSPDHVLRCTEVGVTDLQLGTYYHEFRTKGIQDLLVALPE